MSGARAPTGVTAPAAARVEDVIAGWRAPALIVLVVIGVAALYWPSTQSLLHEWLDTPDSVYGHGALVAIVMLTLILRSVHAARLTPEPEAKALWWLLLAAASLAWLVALRTGIQVAHQLMLPALMWLAIRALFGRRVAALCLVPVALLYCAIPVWHAAIPLLQDMTVVVVRTLLRLVGIAAYAQDEFIYIRGAVFQVEEGCAGLRYFTVGIAIAAVVGAMRGDGWRTYAKLMSFAIALTIAANWLRVFIVIVAGHLTDMQHYFVRVEHVSLGWAVFALGMLVFLLVVRRWPSPRAEVAGPAKSAGFRPVHVIPVLVALTSGPVWSWVAPVEPAAGANVSLPAANADWRITAPGCDGGWRPTFAAADLESLDEFEGPRGNVCAYLATYLSQHQDKELIGYGSQVLGAPVQLREAGPREFAGKSVNEARIAGLTGTDRLVWYGYVVGDRQMRRGIEAQMRYAVGSLYGSPAASVFAISASCAPDCDTARESLGSFLVNLRIGDADD